MNDKKIFSRVLGATALSMLLAAPVFAQSTSTRGADMTDRANATGSSSSGASSSADSAKSGSGSQVAKEDQKFMEDISHANLAEIETGKLALEKSQNDQVKKFAQQMIDDHTKAQKELEGVAQKKGVTLPTETDTKHKAKATTLKALSGDTFDKQYVSHGGVGDHEATHKLLQKVEKDAKDPELKAYAAKTIKSVDQHLAEAKKLNKEQKDKK